MEGAFSSPPTGVLYHAHPCMPNLQFLLPCAYWAAPEKLLGRVSSTFIPALEFWSQSAILGVAEHFSSQNPITLQLFLVLSHLLGPGNTVASVTPEPQNSYF